MKAAVRENIDAEYLSRGLTVCGIDEVGRGPLYGDVVAAAVILPAGFDCTGIDDSKKLSEKKRIALDARIRAAARVGIGRASASEIDRINILQATKLAMKRAIADLGVRPDLLLIDAVRLDDIDIEQVSLIKGDQRSVSIGAASIVAKVYRDNLLKEAGLRHPEYGFESHKGYGTKKHVEAIREHGALPEHRRSFLKNILSR